jgi:hypothetical protein
LPLDVDATQARGLWLRHTPLALIPRVRPARPNDHRWQRGPVLDALHLCGDEAGVWAQWHRRLADCACPARSATARSLDVRDRAARCR